MPKNSANKNTKKRVEVKDIPAPEKELSVEDAKSVKGGKLGNFEIQPVKAGDGSVKPQDAQSLKAGASEVLMIKK